MTDGFRNVFAVLCPTPEEEARADYMAGRISVEQFETEIAAILAGDTPPRFGIPLTSERR
jgi:hypothetical protein